MAGRPREFDRDTALERARNLFWNRGYEGTSLADLVAELELAPARIYAAFGSKEELFRKAVENYREKEGSFAERALKEEPTARRAIERMLRDAVNAYSLPGRPRGCMVVADATNCSKSNEPVAEWLAEQRRQRTAQISARLRAAVALGELRKDTDVEALGDYFATVMNGMSVQARDGVSKRRLLAFVPTAMQALDAVSV